MKKLLIIAFSIFISASLLAQNADPRLKGVDEELEALLSPWSIPGFAVAVVEKDKIIYSKGFGYRDVEAQLQMTENTLLAIGSSSKAFTSAVLGVLQGEEKVDLNERPAKYIPELRFNKPWMNEQIIIKDLMSHRTGLPRHDFGWYLFPSNSDEELLGRIAHHEPFTGLRQQWYYNNWMFFLQGQIGKSVTGNSWEENVQSMFFDKLGMTRSNFKTQEMAKDDNSAKGYQTDEEGVNSLMDYYDISAMGAAGAINSSVTEMANWLITWVNGGKFNGEEIIPEAYVKEAMSSHMVVSAGTPAPEHPDMQFSNYGYGWFLSSYRGHYRVEHGGNIDGFSASASFFPTDSIGIVVLVNQNRSSTPGNVRNIIADRMLGLEPVDWSGENLEVLKKRKEAALKAKEEEESAAPYPSKPSRSLDQYLGTYDHPGYGEMELTWENDSLYLNTGSYQMYLAHDNHDTFNARMIRNNEVQDGDAFKVQFSMDLNGDINGAKIGFEPTLDPIQFKRTPTAVEVTADDLSKYEGTYSIMGVQEAKVYIKDGALFVFVAGQPEYEQIPIGEHEFKFKTLDGFKVIFEEKDGEIVALTAVQPNGSFRGEKVK